MLWSTEVSNSLCNTWACIIQLNDCTSGVLKEETTSDCGTSWTYLLLLRLVSICRELDRPWYEIAPHTVTPVVRPLCHSKCHYECILEGSVVRHSVNTNHSIMGLQVEASFIWKDNLVPVSLSDSVLMSPLKTQPSMISGEWDPVQKHPYPQSVVRQTSMN